MKGQSKDILFSSNPSTMAESSNSCFYTIILNPQQLQQLKIPDEFIDRHGNHLPTHMQLCVPDRETWPVKILKQDGRVCIGEGWRKFSAHYCLYLGHFLVFQYSYNRDSSFHVLVFDMSATEIDYLSFSRVIEIVDDDDSDSDKGCGSEKEKEEEEEYQPRWGAKRMRLEENPLRGIDETRARARCYESEEENSITAVNVNRNRILDIVTRAAGFKSCKPHFLVHMSPSHVHRSYNFYVPAKHCREYFIEEAGEEGNHNKRRVSLCTVTKDGETRTWEVNYEYRSCGSRSFRVRFLSGWKDFAMDNELCVGDACAFELINQAAKLYRVTVMRVNQGDPAAGKIRKRTRRQISSGNGRTKARRRSSRQKVKHNHGTTGKARSNTTDPHFLVYMSPYHVHGNCRLYVPVKHSREYFCEEEDVEGNQDNTVSLCATTKDGVTRSWEVSYRYWHDVSRSSRVQFLSGWKEFVRDNRLCVGDPCLFELINQEAKLYRVTLIRGNQEGPIVTKRSLPAAKKISKRPAMKSAKAFQGVNPHFTVYMYPTYAEGVGMRIPQAHSDLYFKNMDAGGSNYKFITLYVNDDENKSESKRYRVKFTMTKNRSSTFVRLGGGWSTFVDNNGIQVGDVCVFELVEVESRLYKVTIFHGGMQR